MSQEHFISQLVQSVSTHLRAKDNLNDGGHNRKLAPDTHGNPLENLARIFHMRNPAIPGVAGHYPWLLTHRRWAKRMDEDAQPLNGLGCLMWCVDEAICLVGFKMEHLRRSGLHTENILQDLEQLTVDDSAGSNSSVVVIWLSPGQLILCPPGYFIMPWYYVDCKKNSKDSPNCASTIHFTLWEGGFTNVTKEVQDFIRDRLEQNLHRRGAYANNKMLWERFKHNVRPQH